MTTYKGIQGTAVQNYAGNIPNPVDGQVWYDSTAADFKYQYPNVTTAAWSTGGNLNTARVFLAGAGTQTSTLAFGGNPGIVALTESYNGSAWTEVADLNTGRFALAGAGVSNTSALAFGGRPSPTPVGAETESWNGSSWTEVNDLNTARSTLTGGGTNTSALAFGGTTNSTELWNGTSWTANPSSLNTSRNYLGGVATDSTSALAFGGGPNLAITESWNGSSWTEVAD